MGTALQDSVTMSSSSCILIFLFLGFVSCEEMSPLTASDCPSGWSDASSVDMGCLLFHSTQPMIWTEAIQYCKRAYTNGSLVEILTPQQLDFLVMDLLFLETQVGNKLWWTGGTDFGEEGDWTWSRSRESVGDFVWHSSEPNSGIGSDCM